MKTFDFIVTSYAGIHAKIAVMLVQEVKNLSSDVNLDFQGKVVNAKNMIGVLALNVRKNDKITICIEGEKEENELEQLKKFCQRNL